MTEGEGDRAASRRGDASSPGAASSRGVSSPHPQLAGALGVIGGTFDPIHYGHLAIAEEARSVLGLRRVLFVPARQPPHKPGRPISPAEDRVAMVELAIFDNPGFELSRVEVDRPGPSYTVETIAQVRDRALEAGEVAQIAFILSAEALAGLASWRDPERLLALCHLVVAPRPGHAMPERAAFEERFPGCWDRIVLLDGPNVCASGSEIRRRAGQGRSIRYHLPAGVAAYIADHHLYDPPR